MQIADTRAVMFCVEREERLCFDVVSAVAVHDPSAVSPHARLLATWYKHSACLVGSGQDMYAARL